ncbi:SpaA isopeptide-forming pilin-related protein [Ohessyouella blattaphilus]|uniref:SpaA isopeptide-forming pilin-related protein n=1 Tax=Ohessyouella blattaphilus TaxID=2949333 RepID=A0ABT1EJN8_9FIRM|nr:SpaA isopeptide-forming pilin-related protein [Ohessyouella blattaphilus]MCP1110917.1 SpaA isopeptide-forming pilin-related protein [Ohessyouella blattaphilus]MCR8564311.1 SpaA isopeptide-forming pilin-related protein [Ohessyouella blattaphilus]
MNQVLSTRKRRILSVLLIMAIFFSIFSTTSIDTKAANTVSISFTYVPKTGGGNIKWIRGFSVNGYHDAYGDAAGKQIMRMYASGSTAFCIQPGTPVNPGDQLTLNSSEAWNNLSEGQKQGIRLALLYGYQGNYGALTGTDGERWVATQFIIWELVAGCRYTSGNYACHNGTIIDAICSNNYNPEIRENYNRISGYMANYGRTPSFTGSVQELTWDGSKYSKTISDTNTCLNNFNVTSTDNRIAITKSGNNLTLASTEGFNGEIAINMTKHNIPKVTESSKLIACGSPYVQDVVIGVENVAGISAGLKVKAPYGKLKLLKTSEDGIVSGLRFKLTGNGIDKIVTTDKNGQIFLADLKPGAYTITEQMEERYANNEAKTIQIVAGKTTTVSFENRLKKFRVEVAKKDSVTGSSQGDATLEGAIYGIYQGEKLIDTYTTDKNGNFTTKYYICGENWSIKEITPSEGYLLNSTSYKIGSEAKLYTIEYNNTKNTVVEEVILGRVAIVKHADDGKTGIDTPESNAEFEVFLKKSGSYKDARDRERDHLTTDENGYAITKDLPYGIYTVHQIKGLEGHEFVPDFDVFISANGKVYPYILNNALFKSYVKIIKQDAETGKPIPYAGAGFKLYDSDGNLITMKTTYPNLTIIDTFYTDSTGQLLTPEELPYGSYTLVEEQAPYGYVLDQTPVPFTITEDGKESEGDLTITKVVKENAPQKGKIKITKIGELFAGVSNDNDIYQPIYNLDLLEGATFNIFADEDIITPDGTTRSGKDELVDTVTVPKGGCIHTKELYLGAYRLEEVTAPSGFVLQNEPIHVTLSYAGQEVAVTETAKLVENIRQKVEVSLKKILEKNEDFGIGINEELQNVSFGLYADEDLVAADGNIIPADGLLEIAYVEINGLATFKTDIPFGKYYVKEVATDNHYVISEDEYPFEFAYGEPTQDVIKISLNDDKEIENKLIYGSVKGLKVDAKDKPLAGTLFGLFKPSEEELTKENAILLSTSGKDGRFGFENVPYGTWVIKELEAPEGYVLLKDPVSIIIDKNEQVFEITIDNTMIIGIVQLHKVSASNPKTSLGGAIFEVYRDTNKDKIHNQDDELIGTMQELNDGLYEMKSLEYGGYFVVEKKAPDGYKRDTSSYYFEVIKDGETITVENSAGVGFTNEELPETPKTKKKVETGDSNNPLPAILLLLSFGAIAGTIIYKKRTKKKTETKD